jgi:N-acetylglucosaminyldiphosphoundecaprenol N-acetyl-beta-D-mannosaminyltransferase
MIDLGKKNILGIYIDSIDYDAAVNKVIKAAILGHPMTISALAVHGVMTGVLNKDHQYRLNHLDMIVPDGQPVRWALNWLHHTSLIDRVYGPSLMIKICEYAAIEGIPIYLYGSHPQVVESLARNLQSKIANLLVAGYHPSHFRRISKEEKSSIAQEIRSSGAGITFVGLGCPRQEVWIYEYRDELPMPLIAVGAAFDFHAGVLPQAPGFIQRIGMEWFYRLMSEPRRLWKRYLFLNPMFLLFITMQKIGARKYDPEDCSPPIEELLYG